MRYLCIHCDEKFELPSEQELRCPKCMRVHGLRPLAGGTPPKARWRRSPALLAAIALFVCALGAGAYAFLRHDREPDAVTLASGPLDQSALDAALVRAGVDAADLTRLLVADPSVEAFARGAVSGAIEPIAKARAVSAALRTRAQRGGFVNWSLSDPRQSPPMPAAQVLAAIAKDGARIQLYPLEIAALGVAALRALSVPAMLIELHTLGDERAPLDPSGRFGYFAVAVGESSQTAHIFDVYGGRPERTGCAECGLLSDLAAVGAALSLRACQRMARNEAALAIRDADAAAKLLPDSPSVRTARGTVLLATGASDLGQREFEAAAQLRPDGARRNNLAMLHLARGDAERATQEVARALEQHPDFAMAHVTLAQIHLARGERELCRAELEKAEALDSKLPVLPLTWAEFHASAGENDQAIEYARRAVQARPADPQVRLLLGRIYREASRYDEMRAEAQAALSLAPASLAPQMRELIIRMLGPTALETNIPEADAEASSAAQPSLLQPPGKEPKIRLTDPDTSLQLRQP
jgi:Flp pilus assembly protein TadD